MPPVTVNSQRLSSALSDANLRSMRRPVAIFAIRTSTSANASAGITLVLLPPPATPTLTVRPRFNSVHLAHRLDHTRQAPAARWRLFQNRHRRCAATPRISMRQFPVPLRAVL